MIIPNVQFWNAVMLGNPSALSATLATGLKLDEEGLAGLQTALGALQTGFERAEFPHHFRESLALLEMGQKGGDIASARGPLMRIGKVLESVDEAAYTKGLHRGRVFLLGPSGRFASTRKIREQIVEVIAGKPNQESLFSKEPDQNILTLWDMAVRYSDAQLIQSLYLDDLAKAATRIQYKRKMMDSQNTLSSMAASEPMIFDSEQIPRLTVLAAESWDAALAMTFLAVKRKEIFAKHHMFPLVRLAQSSPEIALAVHALAIRRSDLFDAETVKEIGVAAKRYRDAVLTLVLIAAFRKNLRNLAIEGLKTAALLNPLAAEALAKNPYS